MRFRNSYSLMGIFALAICGLVMFGCSDDDTPPPTQPDGDVVISSEGLYTLASAQVDAQMDSILVRLKAGVEAATVESVHADDRGVFGPNPHDSASSGDWFVRWASNLVAGLGTSTIDSIQYVRGGVVQSNAVDADAVTFNHSWSLTNADTTVTYADVDFYSHLSIVDVNLNTVTIDGNLNLTVHSKDVSADSTIWQDWDIQTSLVALRLEKSSGWESACPSTGMLEMTISHTYQKDNDVAIVTNWEVNVSFNDGKVFVNTTNNNDITKSSSYQACTQ